MREPRFFDAELKTDDSQLTLSDWVCRHAIQVLRLKTDDTLRLFNGQGLEVRVRLTEVSKREASGEVLETLPPLDESPLSITLLQGISRGERMDFAIQKAVELGVTRIVPVHTARCNVQLKGERADKRLRHWHGVMVAACEQSGRAHLPELTEIQTLEAAVSERDETTRLVLDPTASQQFHDIPDTDSVALLIGPEGGLSDDEIQFATANQFVGLGLGPRILRTETAALVALTLVQARWGDLT